MQTTNIHLRTFADSPCLQPSEGPLGIRAYFLSAAHFLLFGVKWALFKWLILCSTCAEDSSASDSINKSNSYHQVKDLTLCGALSELVKCFISCDPHNISPSKDCDGFHR